MCHKVATTCAMIMMIGDKRRSEDARKATRVKPSQAGGGTHPLSCDRANGILGPCRSGCEKKKKSERGLESGIEKNTPKTKKKKKKGKKERRGLKKEGNRIREKRPSNRNDNWQGTSARETETVLGCGHRASALGSKATEVASSALEQNAGGSALAVPHPVALGPTVCAYSEGHEISGAADLFTAHITIHKVHWLGARKESQQKIGVIFKRIL